MIQRKKITRATRVSRISELDERRKHCCLLFVYFISSHRTFGCKVNAVLFQRACTTLFEARAIADAEDLILCPLA